MLASNSTARGGVLAAALLSVACNGGVALEDVPAEYASAFCEPIQDCAGDLAARTMFGGGNCETFFAGSLRNSTLPNWMALLDRGTVGYDSGMAATCIDGVRALGCDIFISTAPPECNRIFTGTVEEGGACSLSEECAGDAYCDGAACPGSPGTCAARKSNGADCGADGECTSGLVCEDGTCGPPSSRSGGQCGGGSGLECPLDEICVGADDEMMTPGTCTPRADVQIAALGETCDALAGMPLCQSGLSCALIGGGAGGLEFECAERVSAGAACNIALPSMCPDDQYCDADPMTTGSFEGTCVALPTDGMPCADSLEGRCAPGLSCVTDGGGTSTCVRPADNGASCASDGECFSSNCATGTCAAPELCAG